MLVHTVHPQHTHTHTHRHTYTHTHALFVFVSLSILNSRARWECTLSTSWYHSLSLLPWQHWLHQSQAWHFGLCWPHLIGALTTRSQPPLTSVWSTWCTHAVALCHWGIGTTEEEMSNPMAGDSSENVESQQGTKERLCVCVCVCVCVVHREEAFVPPVPWGGATREGGYGTRTDQPECSWLSGDQPQTYRRKTHLPHSPTFAYMKLMIQTMPQN